jgi:hypothetical protein
MMEKWPGSWWNDCAIGGITGKTGEMIAQAGEVTEKIGGITAQAGEVVEKTGEMPVQAGEVAEETGEMPVQAGEVAEQIGEMIVQAVERLRKLGNDCAGWGMAAQAGKWLRKHGMLVKVPAPGNYRKKKMSTKNKCN